jgi:hypothetical protein
MVRISALCAKRRGAQQIKNSRRSMPPIITDLSARAGC